MFNVHKIKFFTATTYNPAHKQQIHQNLTVVSHSITNKRCIIYINDNENNTVYVQMLLSKKEKIWKKC